MKRTALHIASESGHASIVSALFAHNVNYDAVDCEGIHEPVQLLNIIYDVYIHLNFCLISK